MADKSKTHEADAQFRKSQRAEDGRKAMSEYEAEAAAVAAKTARLKALRLAKEAAELSAPKPAAPAKKKASKTSKAKPEKLADWLDGQKGSGRNS